MKRDYKKLISFLFLLLFFTGCSSLEGFNKGLNDFNKKLSSITGTPIDSASSSSKGGKVVALNVNTGGKGKFENFKVRVYQEGGRNALYFSGFYTNISKKNQNFVVEFDLLNEDGSRIRGEHGTISFLIEDVRPGERINIEKDTVNTRSTYLDQRINLQSMRAYYI